MTGVQLPETRFSRVVDHALTVVGRAASWLWVVLLAVIVVNVTLRYVFQEGRIELEELQWHLNAFAFLIAIAYAYRVDAHIRIDLVSVRLQPRLQVWIEFYSTLLLLLPFIAVVLWFSFPFVAHSWTASEVSSSPGGLPFRWLLKGVLPVAFLLLLIAVASRLTRLWAYLTDGPP
ncbi:MAG: TRAP transporter small permease subunit [Gammaproteobacteria bacterium]|nr:TRAP transporter small permease subunit [Gammaproteobacteria bacterium]MDE0440944.1 TRAP transporter small permease subunit [Gammaproteobacteria bacterium]